MKLHFLPVIFLFVALDGIAQKSPQAALLYKQAIADTSASKDSLGGLHFYESAKEELKISQPDYDFTAKNLLAAAKLNYFPLLNYKKAEAYYYEAMDPARKAMDKTLMYEVLKGLGNTYERSKNTYDVFTFPSADKQETLEAYFSIMLPPKKNKPGKYAIAFSGGSNDGVYEGATGAVYGKYNKTMKGRTNLKLGKVTVLTVYPNFSIGQVELFKEGDPFYELYVDDMAAVPIRFPKKEKKDIFLEVSLLNIKFIDNSGNWIAHPRTLMYYASPQLEKDVYASMKSQIYKIYETFHTDTTALYHSIIPAGRFKGKSMMDAMKDTKEDDIKAFFGFVRSFPGNYMGGTWKIAEVYGTWIINNAPLGAQEAMDSLLAYNKNEKLFNQFAKEHTDDIEKNFYGGWIMDAQSFAYGKDFNAAYAWNNVMEKASIAIQNDSLLAWTYFNHGLISSEEKKDSDAVNYYRKAIPLFKKSRDETGASYAINNIGSVLSSAYQYGEAQSYFEQALQIRKGIFAKDTSDDVKEDLARAHSGVGLSLFNQSKYKEAIDAYLKGVYLLKNITELKASKQLAPLYSGIGKSYQQMSQYEEAATYYDLEYKIQYALGDEEAMAGAFDNKAYLLSLVGKNTESYDAYKEAFRLHSKTAHMDAAAFTLSNMGQILWTLGRYDSAIVAHKNAISMRVATKNKKGEAYGWQKLGALYKQSGQPQLSIDAYNKALELSKDLDKEQYGSLLEEFASSYFSVKDYEKAADYYQRAIKVYADIHSKIKSNTALYSLANVYYSGNQFEKADEILDKVLAEQRLMGDATGTMNTLILKGQIQQFFYGDSRKAMSFVMQSLEVATKTNSLINIASSQSALGTLFQNMGSYDSSLEYFDKALSIYKSTSDKISEAYLLNRKGYLNIELVEYAKARKYFNESLAIADSTGNKGLKADALGGITRIEYLSGNFVKALVTNYNVMELWILEKNPWGIADAFISSGNIRNSQSEFSDAISDYQQADSIYTVLHIPKSRATTINNIGDIYLNQNDFVKALPKFMEALQILQKTNDDRAFIALVKANIGEVYIGQKKYGDAEKWLTESLEMARSIKNKKQVYSNDIVLGKLKSLTKEYAAAKTFFEEADRLLKETAEKPVIVSLENEWGKWFLLNNDPVNAEKHLQNSIKLSEEMAYKTHVWKSYATIAQIREQQKNTPAAITELEKAIKVIEELKSRLSGGEEAKKIFASDESVVELYQRMAKYLKVVGRNDEALAYIEKSNIENINLRLKNTDAIGNAAVKEKKTEITTYERQTAEELAKPKEQQNMEKIARLEKMTTIAESDYQQFITGLVKKYPTRTDLQQIDARQFRQERKHIPPEVALLSYLITNDELSIFVAMKDTLLIKDIPIDRSALEQKIKQYYTANIHPRQKNANSSRGADGDASDKTDTTVSADVLSQELYTLLIGPAAEAIKGKSSIAIVPTGLLCFVPFHSLSTKNAAGETQYFGEEKQVFYVNKITAVTNGRNEVMKDLKIIAVGNADKSLASAETEVNGLKNIFPATMVYIGNAATKKNVLGTPGEFNILHLATHGILDYNNAENSYLVFASDKASGDDGKLKINDIYKVKDLDRFRMVTLSACETAVVQNIVEGWPISTASAFIEAGVSTVIATLWKVDDKATSLLIGRFYKNLKNMNKVAALQDAQRYLRSQKEYADPYYWAPFQLVGLWE